MSLVVCEDGEDGLSAFTRSPFHAHMDSPKTPRQTPPQTRASIPGTLVSHLTNGQRDCLRLVYNHLTSKDIARRLGVSPHTVDMRLRTAMKVLGVTTRIDAARVLMQDEHGPDVLPALPPEADPEAYQPLIYGSPDMATGVDSAIFGSSASAAGDVETGLDPIRTDTHQPLKSTFDPSVSGPPRTIDALMPSEAAMLGSRSGAGTTDHGSGARPLADSLPWGARNTLSVPVRLAWIAGIAIGSALSFGAILSALQSLKSLI